MNTTPCKSLGIEVARLVYRGFIHEARELAIGTAYWNPTEIKAILGAGRSLTRFGLYNGMSLAKEVMGMR